MAKEETKLQVNVDFTEYPELYAEFLKIVEADMTDRSKFLRQLIRQEFLRRARGAHWVQVDPTLPYPVTIVNPVVEVQS